MSAITELAKLKQDMAAWAAELEAQSVKVRILTEQGEHYRREAERLAGALREAQHENRTLRECRETWKAQAERLLREHQEWGNT